MHKVMLVDREMELVLEVLLVLHLYSQTAMCTDDCDVEQYVLAKEQKAA